MILHLETILFADVALELLVDGLVWNLCISALIYLGWIVIEGKQRWTVFDGFTALGYFFV